MSEGVAQVVQHVLGKCKTLKLKITVLPSTRTKKKKKQKKNNLRAGYVAQW
jgi:hypothetical protein